MPLDDVFKAMADDHRRRILATVSRGPRRAGDLGRIVGLSPNALSFHLRLLRQAGLVTRRREGRSLVYAASRPAIQDWLNHVRQMWPEGWVAAMAGGPGTRGPGTQAGGGVAARGAPVGDGSLTAPEGGPSTTEPLATELL